MLQLAQAVLTVLMQHQPEVSYHWWVGISAQSHFLSITVLPSVQSYRWSLHTFAVPRVQHMKARPPAGTTKVETPELSKASRPRVGGVHGLNPLLRVRARLGLLLQTCPIPLQPSLPGCAVLLLLLLWGDICQLGCLALLVNLCLDHLCRKASVKTMSVLKTCLVLLVNLCLHHMCTNTSVRAK